MGRSLSREEAWKILCEYVQAPALRAHALAVEAVMRYIARQEGENEEKWGVVGLLHDLDYEKYPDQHCVKVAEILEQLDVDAEYIHAVCSHGYGVCSEIKPEHRMEQVLYTIDELTGLIHATCLMRPSRSVLDVEVKSIKKKFKDAAFAAGVNRQTIRDGCAMFGMELDDVIQRTIMGMREKADEIGLKGTL